MWEIVWVELESIEEKLIQADLIEPKAGGGRYSYEKLSHSILVVLEKGLCSREELYSRMYPFLWKSLCSRESPGFQGLLPYPNSLCYCESLCSEELFNMGVSVGVGVLRADGYAPKKAFVDLNEMACSSLGVLVHFAPWLQNATANGKFKCMRHSGQEYTVNLSVICMFWM